MLSRFVGAIALGMLVGAGSPGHAVPIPACVAGDVVAGDPGCPVSGPCTITQVFTVADGCILDFGMRDVTISVTGELRLGTASMTLKAGSLTVAGGGFIDGISNTVGATFIAETTGDITVVQDSRTGKILMSGSTQGGSIFLKAGGDIRVEGRLHAHNRTVGEAAGGDISLHADGDIVTSSTSEIDPHGGLLAFGGFTDIVAGGRVEIGNMIDNTGGEGGVINIDAGEQITIRGWLRTTGEGDAGGGGEINIIAGTDVVIDENGKLQSKGTGSAVGSGGGDGGTVFIIARFGDVIIGSQINVQSGIPDGGGGELEVIAHGSIDVQSTAELIGDGNGVQSYGGSILLDAGIDVTVEGPVHAGGGDSGGDVAIEAGRDIALNAPVGARSRNEGSFAGSIIAQAGFVASGNMTVTSTIDVSGPGCDGFGFCSLGGDVELTACDLTIESGASIEADAPGTEGSGGGVFLTARDQLTILGSIDATGGGEELDGSISLTHPPGVAPSVTGTALPAPMVTAESMCTGGAGDELLCLDPCPACGNGVTEFPETCDDTTGTPVGCDGCSRFCQLDDCDDESVCSHDSCDPLLGCRYEAVPNGVLCRAAAGSCDLPEMCDGVGVFCPRDRFTSGTVCRSSAGVCDVEEACTGTSATCPADAFKPAGTPCEDGNLCNGNETCQAGLCAAGTPLDCDDGNICTTDSCDPQAGCVYMSVVDFTPCTDDGNPCTENVCVEGVCVATPIPGCVSTTTTSPSSTTTTTMPPFAEPIPTTVGLQRPARLWKLVSKPSPIVRLPDCNTSNPIDLGGRLTVTKDGHALTCNLPAADWAARGTGGWKLLGRCEPGKHKGYKYLNQAAPGGTNGPCKVIILKANVIKILAKSDSGLGSPGEPGENGLTEISLEVGNDRYCAQWGSDGGYFAEKADKLLKELDEPAPAGCAGPVTATTAAANTTE